MAVMRKMIFKIFNGPAENFESDRGKVPKRENLMELSIPHFILVYRTMTTQQDHEPKCARDGCEQTRPVYTEDSPWIPYAPNFLYCAEHLKDHKQEMWLKWWETDEQYRQKWSKFRNREYVPVYSSDCLKQVGGYYRNLW
jgi:hypothetical protein